jgi:uncharacterized membrane protein
MTSAHVNGQQAVDVGVELDGYAVAYVPGSNNVILAPLQQIVLGSPYDADLGGARAGARTDPTRRTTEYPRRLDGVAGVDYGGGLPGARRLLSAIAAAMMAISTVMFSSQTTAMTFIGQEYGSRLLRNFLADTRNQLSFGIYVSTFVYALMVLRTIHKDPDGGPVPHIALSFGIILAIGSLGLLIYSMYHISKFLQASTIIDYAAKDLEATVCRLTSDPRDDHSSAAAGQPLTPQVLFGDDEAAEVIRAETSGYVQSLKEEQLISLCRQSDCRIRMERRVGDFVVAGSALATVSVARSQAFLPTRQIGAAIVLAAEPEIEGDIRNAINQLVQIALRAASTDRNDILTAGMCIDRMGAALCLLARRAPLPPVKHDAAGVARILQERIGFSEALDTCVRPLREFKEATPTVLSHLLAMVRMVAEWAVRDEDRSALKREAERILEIGLARLPGSPDRERIERAYEAACEMLSKHRREPDRRTSA